MKKKIFLIGVGVLVAGGSVWYILNGGTDPTNNDNPSNAGDNQSQSAEVQKDSLIAILQKQKSLKIFNDLIEAAGLTASLQATGPFTVLAPTDDAFKSLPEGMLDTLKKSENKEMLAAIINYHIVKGKLDSASLQNAQKLPTVNGQEVIVVVKDGSTSFLDAKGNKSQAVSADISASNGIIHIVDTVLLPQ